eukprot:6176179-Pleurochrysis_carterae.AAC.1
MIKRIWPLAIKQQKPYRVGAIGFKGNTVDFLFSGDAAEARRSRHAHRSCVMARATCLDGDARCCAGTCRVGKRSRRVLSADLAKNLLPTL